MQCGLNEEIENYMRTVVNHTFIITATIFKTEKSAHKFKVRTVFSPDFCIHCLSYWSSISALLCSTNTIFHENLEQWVTREYYEVLQELKEKGNVGQD